MLSAHIADAIVNYAAKHRTREVCLHLALPRQHADVTDDSIMNFLTAPASGQQIRKLEVTKPRVSPQFFEKLAEAHRSREITSNVDMKLLAVDIMPPTGESGLQFSIITFGVGTVVRCGDELMLTTMSKDGSSDIEYKGRNAGIAEDKDERKAVDEKRKRKKEEPD